MRVFLSRSLRKYWTSIPARKECCTEQRFGQLKPVLKAKYMGARPQSICVGWIDLGEDDQRRAREYLSQFNAGNTLDELGFGILRDVFADVFFPATNTIMTQTRYLIFIPALCRLVEQEKLSGNAAALRLTELENKLREALPPDEEGIIGRVSKESLRRYPSSIYWNALRRLGIFSHQDWGLAYYQAHLSEFYASKKAEKDDDGLAHLSNPVSYNWDKGICDMLDDGCSIKIDAGALPASLSFALTGHEARYLRDRFGALAAKERRPSILSHLLNRLHVAPFSYPWDVPHPESLARHVAHARLLSMLTRGATLQYFQLLQREREKRKIAAPACNFTEAFAGWWEATNQELASWPVDQFLIIAAQVKGLRRANDATFIKSWLKLCVEAKSAQGLMENMEAHELIRYRERITRPSKSRLHHPEYLQRWNSPNMAEVETISNNLDRLRFGFDFRARIGSRFVLDIVRGLAGGH